MHIATRLLAPLAGLALLATVGCASTPQLPAAATLEAYGTTTCAIYAPSTDAQGRRTCTPTEVEAGHALPVGAR